MITTKCYLNGQLHENCIVEMVNVCIRIVRIDAEGRTPLWFGFEKDAPKMGDAAEMEARRIKTP
jgi:hypothetical protein